MSHSEVQSLLEKMTTEEISGFWFRFYSGNAFSETNSRIPYWKTRRQGIYFQMKANIYAFYPKERDEKGKNIIDREELVTHVVSHIANYIQDKIQSNLDSMKGSFLERIPFTLFICRCYRKT